jgi:hypothetical protein
MGLSRHDLTDTQGTVVASFILKQQSRAWIGRYRRLSKDYEYLLASSETTIYVARVD